MDEFITFLIIVLGTVFLGAAIASGAMYLAENSCTRQGRQMEMETKFDVWSGCYLKLKSGQWVPLKQYRAF